LACCYAEIETTNARHQNRVPHTISMICLNDLKAQMMGLSTLNCPGLSTLLLNLSRTANHHLPVGE
jgi:hypothetical protein